MASVGSSGGIRCLRRQEKHGAGENDGWRMHDNILCFWLIDRPPPSGAWGLLYPETALSRVGSHAHAEFSGVHGLPPHFLGRIGYALAVLPFEHGESPPSVMMMRLIIPARPPTLWVNRCAVLTAASAPTKRDTSS